LLTVSLSCLLLGSRIVLFLASASVDAVIFGQ
jgi:hypothetical protein